MAYDGEIRLRTTLDPIGVKESAKELTKTIKGIFDASAGKEINAQFQKAQVQMDKMQMKAEQILNRMHELENTKMPTAEYQEATNFLKQQEEALAKLQERMERYTETGGKRNSKSYRAMEYDLEQLRSSVEYAKSEVEELNKSGKAFTLGSDTEEYQKLTESLADVNDKMRIASESALQNKMFHEETAEVVDDETNSVEQLATAAEKVEKHSRKVETNFKRILKYAFGIGSLYILANKLRTSAVEGLKDMAAMDDQLNNNVSTMLTSLNQLKADIASIIQPFVDLLLPALTWVLDKLHAVAMNLAQYIAAITGQNYVKVATVQTVNWAKANERLAAASDKALGNYDKLNVINSSSGGGSGAGGGYGFGGGTGETTYNNVALTGIPAKIAETVNGIVEEGADILEDYDNAFKKGGVFGVLLEGVKKVAGVVDDLAHSNPTTGKALDTVVNKGADIIEKTEKFINEEVDKQYDFWDKFFDDYQEYKDDMLENMEDEGVAKGFMHSLGNFMYDIVENEDGPLYRMLDDIDWWSWGDDTSGGEWTNDPVKKKELRDALEAHEKEMDELHERFSKHFWEWAMEDESAMEQAGEEALNAYGEGLTDKPTARIVERGIDVTTNAIADAITSVSSFFKKGTQTGESLNQGIEQGSTQSVGSTVNGLNRNLWTIREQMNPHVLDGAGNETGQNFEKSIQSGAQQSIPSTVNGLTLTMETIKNMLNPNALSDKGNTVGTNYGKSVTEGINSSKSGVVTAGNDMGSSLGKGVAEGIRSQASGAVSAIDALVGSIQTKSNGVLSGIKSAGENIATSMLNGIKNVITTNVSIKDAISKFLEDSMSSTFQLTGTVGGSSAVNKSTSLLKLHAVKLAQGAVIPANREFLAMLGDQTQGTNIEAPLDTIVSAMKQALGESGGHADINLNLDGHTIAKVVWDKTEQRYKQTGRTAYGY